MYINVPYIDVGRWSPGIQYVFGKVCVILFGNLQYSYFHLKKQMLEHTL